MKWFPILSSFSRVIIDSEGTEVRAKALESVFEILKSSNHIFDSKYWKLIFKRIILPIFEDLKDQHDGKKESKSDSNKLDHSSIWIQGMRMLVDLVTDCFEKISENDLDVVTSVLDLITALLKRRNEKVILNVDFLYILMSFFRSIKARHYRGSLFATVSAEKCREIQSSSLLGCYC